MKAKHTIISCFLILLLTLQPLMSQALPLTVPLAYKETPGLYNFTVIRGNSGGYGSAFAVTPRVVVTASHVLFDDNNLNWIPRYYLNSDKRINQSDIQDFPEASLLALTGYSARVAADDSPGYSSYETFNRDFAVIRSAKGISPYLWNIVYSDSTTAHPLVGSGEKILYGFPREAELIHPANYGKLHSTAIGTARLTVHKSGNDPSGNSWAIYESDDFLTGGGNSGGPLTVDGIPAGILVGGGEGYSIVRGFNSEVHELINSADTSSGGPGYKNYTVPEILEQSEDIGFFEKNTVILKTFTTRYRDTTWQWFRNDTAIPGETSETIIIENITSDLAGDYVLKATNTLGTTESSPINVYHHSSPIFISSPSDLHLGIGDKYSMVAFAESTGSISYYWYQYGDNKAWTPSDHIDLVIDESSAGEWWIEAVNSDTTVESAHFDITTFGFDSEMEDIDMQLGESVSVTAPITNFPTAIYQWYFRKNSGYPFKPINGKTSITLSFDLLVKEHEGDYKLLVTDTSSNSSTSSESFRISIDRPVFIQSPSSGNQQYNTTWGRSVYLSIWAEGDFKPFTYQWYFNSTPLPGKTYSDLNIDRLLPDKVGVYYVKVIDSNSNEVESSHITISPSTGATWPVILDLALVDNPTPLKSIVQNADGPSAEEAVWYPHGYFVLGDLILQPKNPVSQNYSIMEQSCSDGKLSVLTTEGSLIFYSSNDAAAQISHTENAHKISSTDYGPVVHTRDNKCFVWFTETNTDMTPPRPLSDKSIVEIKSFGNLVWIKDTENHLWEWNLKTDELSHPAGNNSVHDFSLRRTNKAILLRDGTVLQAGYQYQEEVNGELIWKNDPIPSFPSPAREIDVTDNATMVVMENNNVVLWGKIPLPKNSLLGDEGDLYPILNYDILCKKINTGSRYIQIGKRDDGVQPDVKLSPDNFNISEGDAVTIRVDSDIRYKSYRWFLNRQFVTNTTYPYLEIKHFKESHSGIYDVEVFDSVGYSMESTGRVYALLKDNIVIYGNAPNRTILPGQIATSLHVISTENFVVNWYNNGEFFNQSSSPHLYGNFGVENSGMWQAEVVSLESNIRQWSEPFWITVSEPKSLSSWAGEFMLSFEEEDLLTDLDGDGMPLIMEYILNTNPLRNDTPRTSITSDYLNQFLNVEIDPTHNDTKGYKLTVYTSNDLTTWKPHDHQSLGNNHFYQYYFTFENENKLFYKFRLGKTD